MVRYEVPACPRCTNGGKVKLIDEKEDSGIFKPLPIYPPRTLVFQCECGWATTVKFKPEQCELMDA